MSTIKLGPSGLWEGEREGTHKLGLLQGLAGKAQLADGCVLDGVGVPCVGTVGGGSGVTTHFTPNLPLVRWCGVWATSP